MLTILFVDPDPDVLERTRSATVDLGESWDMHFVSDAGDALALVAERPVDVVVSDMRVPVSEGVDLLAQLKLDSPATARIILSGYAEEEALFRSTRVAHQFLTKPCDVEELRRTVEELRRCREVVTPDAILDLVGQVDELPALGDVYRELTEAIEGEDATNDVLGAIVSKDVALTAELLRLVNSAFFGLSRKVDSVDQAIGFLGIDVVRAIVAAHSLFGSEADALIDLGAISHRAQVVAGLARKGVALAGGPVSEQAEAFLAGMLHDVGALALSEVGGFDPDDLRAVLASEDSTTERLAFGVDRFAVGAYLLGLWGFSTTIVEALASLSELQAVDPHAGRVAWALRVACQAQCSGRAPVDPATLVDDDLEPLLAEVDRQLRRTAATPA